MKQIRKFFILLKRSFTRPIYILVLLTLPAAAIGLSLIHQENLSSDITVGYIIYDSSDNMEQLKTLLNEEDKGFTFNEYKDIQGLESDAASGKIDCGYIIPESFSENFIKNRSLAYITQIISPASLFSDVSEEIIYNHVIAVYATDILQEYFQNDDIFSVLQQKDSFNVLNEYYENYLSGDHLFSLETEALSENQTVPAYTDTFPFQEFTGLIIYITALLGLLNYMKDNQNNVYGRLSKRKRLSFCIMNIMADITPAAILGFVALAVYNKGASLFLMMLQMIFYIFICLILCIIFRFIFRSYKIYCGVLPLLIVCALLLSGIKILSLYIY